VPFMVATRDGVHELTVDAFARCEEGLVLTSCSCGWSDERLADLNDIPNFITAINEHIKSDESGGE
jgi:hypothetical protein